MVGQCGIFNNDNKNSSCNYYETCGTRCRRILWMLKWAQETTEWGTDTKLKKCRTAILWKLLQQNHTEVRKFLQVKIIESWATINGEYHICLLNADTKGKLREGKSWRQDTALDESHWTDLLRLFFNGEKLTRGYWGYLGWEGELKLF